jgi:hypothetical protein
MKRFFFSSKINLFDLALAVLLPLLVQLMGVALLPGPWQRCCLWEVWCSA